ncbi:MAG: hypothetical protein ABI721_02135 [Candidatus Dojkabacteria bacterium]
MADTSKTSSIEDRPARSDIQQDEIQVGDLLEERYLVKKKIKESDHSINGIRTTIWFVEDKKLQNNFMVKEYKYENDEARKETERLIKQIARQEDLYGDVRVMDSFESGNSNFVVMYFYGTIKPFLGILSDTLDNKISDIKWSLKDRVEYLGLLGRKILKMAKNRKYHFDLKLKNIIVEHNKPLFLDVDTMVDLSREDIDYSKNPGEDYPSTPNIISPERIQEEPIIDFYKSEVYSFGLIAFGLIFKDMLIRKDNFSNQELYLSFIVNIDFNDKDNPGYERLELLVDRSPFALKQKDELKILFRQILQVDPNKRIGIPEFLERLEEITLRAE